MTAPVGLESDIGDPVEHALSGAQFLDSQDRFEMIAAPAITLMQVLRQSGAPQKLGFLSLDVEGAEIEVLKGLDMASYRFNWILVESRDFRVVEKYLSENGYQFIGKLSHHDYLFRDAG